jgi:hypothetical protein
MPAWTSRNFGLGRLQESRSQSRMRTSAIVVANVLAKDSLKMAFVKWDERVDALTPDGSDQPFAIRIRLGRPDRRFQDPYAETLQLGI